MVIKTLELQNPFADYGNIVTGNRFVGRKYAINQIQNRVLNDNYGNIAIIGLPRIGKSSLVWNTLFIEPSTLKREKTINIWINVGTLTSNIALYKKLLNKIALFFKKEKDSELYKELLNIKDEYLKSEDLDSLEYLFALIKQAKYRVVCVLDEFDNASRILELSDFQFLRELSISPETKVCLTTISRRTIQEIESENGAISNFYGVFSELRLGMFSNDDLVNYWKMVESFDISISESYKNTVKYYVGNHPYLIDLFNYEVFNLWKQKSNKTIEEILNETENRLKLNLFNNFESILNLLNEEALYSKALQMVLGPIYDVKIVEEQKLLKYEFLNKIDVSAKQKLLFRNMGINKEGKGYVCFSDYFTEMLSLKISEIDYWPLWSKTEKFVRELIKEYLLAVFGDNWEIDYLKKYESSKGKRDAIRKLNDVRSITYSKFGDLASSHLVDYTFPRDMYDLFISTDWQWFGEVLNDSKKEWGKRFNVLSEIRNPIAHNNSEFISDEELKMGKEVCNLIINRIDKWRKV